MLSINKNVIQLMFSQIFNQFTEVDKFPPVSVL